MNVNELSLKALTNIRNHLADTPDGGRIKTSQEKAVAAVLKLAKEKGVDVSKAFDVDGNPVKVTPSTKKEKKEKKQKDKKREGGQVIRVVAEELLMRVVDHDEDKRPLGMPYADVLAEIHRQFPGSSTSVACLRWYAVRMRERNLRVPNRPRARPDGE